MDEPAAKPEACLHLDSTRLALATLLVAVSAGFSFVGLGHHALWDDEAMTALAAEGVIETGDTSAVVGHNLVAHRDGAHLGGLYDRYMPPLPAYTVAPFLKLLGPTAFAARLPFALCGLACALLAVAWLVHDRATRLTWVLVTLGVLGNASLFLYFRQCRYYGIVILATVAAGYLYLHWQSTWRYRVAFTVATLAILSSNYLDYAAFWICLAADYAIWGRKRRPLTRLDLLAVLVPQVLVAIPLILIWNPTNKVIFTYQPKDWWADKIELVWRNFRDMNRCEYVVGALWLAAPIVARWAGRPEIRRAAVALAVASVTIAFLSPQPVQLSKISDIRYLAMMIPLGIVLGVLVLDAIGQRAPILAVSLALVAFGTNLLNAAPLGMPARSTSLEFARELHRPAPDPYSQMAKWLKTNVPENTKVWVVPSFMALPLMYHAPEPVYAWQLPRTARERYPRLDPIHFRGLVPVDLIVAFGPIRETLPKALKGPDGQFPYRPIARLETYWKDTYRPELILRTFAPIQGYDSEREAIYVYARADLVENHASPPPPTALTHTE